MRWTRLLRGAIEPLLALASGDQAADVGAGFGPYTSVLADAVGPARRVIATDIDPAVIAELRRVLGRRPEVVPRRVGPRETGLADVPPGALALVLMINSLAFEKPPERGASVPPRFDERDRAYLAEVSRRLRPGGKLVLHVDSLRSRHLDTGPTVALLQAAGWRGQFRRIPYTAAVPLRACDCRGPGRPVPIEQGDLLVCTRR